MNLNKSRKVRCSFRFILEIAIGWEHRNAGNTDFDV